MSRSLDPTTRKVLLVLAAFALASSALVHAWFMHAGPDGMARFGLWGLQVAGRLGEVDARWDNVRTAGFEVVVAGYVATIASLVGVILAVGCVVRAPSVEFARTTTRTLTVALVAMAAFVVVVYAFGGVNGMTALSPDWALVVGPLSAIASRRLVGAG